MGYATDTQMAAFIPPEKITKTAGTWTTTLASNVVSSNKTAAADAPNLFIPLNPPLGNAAALKGCRIKSVELIYSVATAALTSVTTVEIEKQTIAASGAVTGTTLAQTQDAGHDTSAERSAIGNHRMICTVTNPEWIDNDAYYYLYVTINAAATSDFKLYGAIVNYELRV